MKYIISLFLFSLYCEAMQKCTITHKNNPQVYLDILLDKEGDKDYERFFVKMVPRLDTREFTEVPMCNEDFSRISKKIAGLYVAKLKKKNLIP